MTLHTFTLGMYAKHLLFDGLGDVGGYYAATFCRHRWHRWGIAVASGMATTLALVALVG